jgi:MFS family permease
VSDRLGRRQPIVLAGYGLSSFVRPLMALAGGAGHVWLVRFADRIGKGVRGAPRDALLAHFAPADGRGRVFGFHRAMDHVGAVLGPLAAVAVLARWPASYRGLFAATIIPGLVVVALLTRVREPGDAAARRDAPAPAASRPPLPREFWRLMGILAVFTLGNSTDMFLIAWLGDVGVGLQSVLLLYAAQHVVKASSSAYGGVMADRLGRRTLIASGWVVYAAIYAGFAITTSANALGALFLVYGLYHGLTEGAEKALIADVVPAASRATAFGVYGATLGLGSLAASALFGAIAEWVSMPAAFLTGAALALAATGGLVGVRATRPPRD